MSNIARNVTTKLTQRGTFTQPKTTQAPTQVLTMPKVSAVKQSLTTTKAPVMTQRSTFTMPKTNLLTPAVKQTTLTAARNQVLPTAKNTSLGSASAISTPASKAAAIAAAINVMRGQNALTNAASPAKLAGSLSPITQAMANTTGAALPIMSGAGGANLASMMPLAGMGMAMPGAGMGISTPFAMNPNSPVSSLNAFIWDRIMNPGETLGIANEYWRELLMKAPDKFIEMMRSRINPNAPVLNKDEYKMMPYANPK